MFAGKNKKLKRTTLICVFLLFLLVGLYLAKLTTPLATAWLLVIIVAIPIVYVKPKGIILVACLVLSGLIIGWWRGGLLQAQNQHYKPLFYKNVSVVGRATEDSFYADRSQLQFAIEDIYTNSEKLPGKIQVKGFGEAMIYRHDIVAVKGKLYPALGGKQANISFAAIDVKARASSPVDDIKRKFIVGMENALPEPAASFAVGLLVGQRSLMTDEVSAVLVAVGLTHIVAVSGYNLTIIIDAVKKSLRKMSRFQTLAASLLLIYLFLLVTGFSPSIVRATIVSVFGLVAWYFGRSFRPILLILLAAALTATINPYYIWNDVGWYLSFLAFFGVLVLAPMLTTRVFGKNKVPIIALVAIESLSAQIMTVPYILLIFGRVSIVGLLANIIIVPLVPFAMLFSLIAGLAGMILPQIAGWIALPARILLDMMLWLTAWFAKWPLAQARASITIGSLFVLYAIVIIFILGLRKRSISVTIESKQTKRI